MLSVNEIIVVEGRYDKIRLSSIVDTVIVTTDGFGVYKNKEKIELLRKLSKQRGIIILTDSDTAGFRIRNYIKSCLGDIDIRHAYIPEVKGKEKRKNKAGSEGLLGVEGIDDETIITALKKADVTPSNKKETVTKADFFKNGLAGTKDSATKRRALAKKLGLPQKMSANALLDVINSLYSIDEYHKLTEE